MSGQALTPEARKLTVVNTFREVLEDGHVWTSIGLILDIAEKVQRGCSYDPLEFTAKDAALVADTIELQESALQEMWQMVLDTDTPAAQRVRDNITSRADTCIDDPSWTAIFNRMMKGTK